MKIKRIAWQNYKGIADGEIISDGADVTISGRNGAGKTSIAEILPFVLFGKITGSVKPYENGMTAKDPSIVHSAEIELDDGQIFQREFYWTPQGNRHRLFINGDEVKVSTFKAHVDKLTNGANELVFNPFAFCGLPKEKQRDFLARNFGAISEREILSTPEFAETAKLFDGLTADCFVAKCKTELNPLQTEARFIPEKISELGRQLESAPADLPAVMKLLQEKISAARAEQSKIQASGQQNLQRDYKLELHRVDQIERQINSTSQQLARARSQQEDLRLKWRTTYAEKCPTCGQRLVGEKRDEQLAEIQHAGEACKAEVTRLTEEKKRLLTELDSVRKSVEKLAKQIEVQASEEARRTEKLTAVRNEIAELEGKLAEMRVLSKVEGRITELETRQRFLNDRITELEGHLHMAEDFRYRKIEFVEADISGNFEHVKFKLFDVVQSTGEIKLTCEAMLNGVPYSALSKGEKLKAALDIFRALQKKFGVETPLFLDDAESYTRNSFVELPNQLWLFKVTDDDLKISVKEGRRAA